MNSEEEGLSKEEYNNLMVLPKKKTQIKKVKKQTKKSKGISKKKTVNTPDDQIKEEDIDNVPMPEIQAQEPEEQKPELQVPEKLRIKTPKAEPFKKTESINYKNELSELKKEYENLKKYNKSNDLNNIMSEIKSLKESLTHSKKNVFSSLSESEIALMMRLK